MGLSKDDFFNHPAVRPGILDALAKDAPKYKGREVQLCFTCDPYQPINEELQITRRAIEILKSNDITVRILTKGGIRSLVDFDLLEVGRDWYGATMTFIDKDKSLKWEPEAAWPHEKICCLAAAKKEGFKTWISLEPVIEPEETLSIIRATYNFVDVFKVGKWNHDARAKEIDWAKFVKQAVTLLDYLDKEYYIKEDLRRHLT